MAQKRTSQRRMRRREPSPGNCTRPRTSTRSARAFRRAAREEEESLVPFVAYLFELCTQVPPSTMRVFGLTGPAGPIDPARLCPAANCAFSCATVLASSYVVPPTMKMMMSCGLDMPCGETFCPSMYGWLDSFSRPFRRRSIVSARCGVCCVYTFSTPCAKGTLATRVLGATESVARKLTHDAQTADAP